MLSLLEEAKQNLEFSKNSTDNFSSTARYCQDLDASLLVEFYRQKQSCSYKIVFVLKEKLCMLLNQEVNWWKMPNCQILTSKELLRTQIKGKIPNRVLKELLRTKVKGKMSNLVWKDCIFGDSSVAEIAFSPITDPQNEFLHQPIKFHESKHKREKIICLFFSKAFAFSKIAPKSKTN